MLKLILFLPLCIVATWTTEGNKLLLSGTPVTLRGIGSTCTEYLLRGVGMKCWATYNWNDKSNVITTPNDPELSAILRYLNASTISPNIKHAVRIPLTASSWLGVETKASSQNMAKYPNLYKQYQTLIAGLVKRYTDSGVLAILDLHWSDDDSEQTPMALRKRSDGGQTGDALLFWDSVASQFGTNPLVFFELYNEPHIDEETWMNGSSEYIGMLEMIQAVRKHTKESILVIAGAAGWAYDSSSLVTLNGKLMTMNESNVMFNFHPYMGPNQAGSSDKCPAGFEAHVQQVVPTGKPMIITEFGQTCCATNGGCESCPGIFNGKEMGYDETILTIASKYNVSWLPWAWRPSANSPGSACMDLNGGDSSGHSLINPTDGKGADWKLLWEKYSDLTEN